MTASRSGVAGVAAGEVSVVWSSRPKCTEDVTEFVKRDTGLLVDLNARKRMLLLFFMIDKQTYKISRRVENTVMKSLTSL